MVVTRAVETVVAEIVVVKEETTAVAVVREEVVETVVPVNNHTAVGNLIKQTF